MLVHDLLDELGIEAHVKTSGSRGLHVYAALAAPLEQLRGAGGGRGAGPRARAAPPGPRSPRSGGRRSAAQRVFVDFNQNAPHKTVFGAWCVRPRVGAQVSTPITWDELGDDRARRAHHRHRAGAAGRAGQRMGGHVRAPAGPHAAARAVGARHGQRPHGRALAARVPEAAERAAAGRPEPRPHNLTRGSRSRCAGPTDRRSPADPGGTMTDLEERTDQPTDAVAEVKAWLEENWDPDLTVAEWWERLGLAGWAAPGLPVNAYGKGLNRNDSVAVQNAIADVRRPRRPRRARAAAGRARPSPPTARRSRSTSTSATSSPARRRGASSSASRAPAPTSPGCRPAPSRTATSGSSPARRCGPPAARSRTWACSSPAPTPTSRSTRASPTSASTCTRRGSRSGPLVEMTGHAMFNEVFMEEAIVPDSALHRWPQQRLGGRQHHADERARRPRLRRWPRGGRCGHPGHGRQRPRQAGR